LDFPPPVPPSRKSLAINYQKPDSFDPFHFGDNPIPGRSLRAFALHFIEERHQIPQRFEIYGVIVLQADNFLRLRLGFHLKTSSFLLHTGYDGFQIVGLGGSSPGNGRWKICQCSAR
jgi:hypothetical protein